MPFPFEPFPHFLGVGAAFRSEIIQT
jgi:hypothetical protein